MQHAGASSLGPEDEPRVPSSASMRHQGEAGRQATPSHVSPGEPGKPPGPCTRPGPEKTPSPARIRPPPQPKRKVVEEGATDLLRDFLGRGDFKKFHLACSQVPSCGNWTLSFLTGQMENSTSSEKTYGDAVESFLRYIASEPEWVELFDLITSSIDDAAKLLDKILHGLSREMGWQVSFQQLETLLQKYYPRNPAQEEALGGDIPQRRDLTHTDEPDLIPLYSFEEAGQPIRGPTTEQDEQLGAAQTDDEDSAQGGAAHEGERYAPYTFNVRPRPLQHSRMVALSKRLTVCLRHDKAEFGLEWTPQAMTPLEKVLSLGVMQEKGAKLEEVLAVVYHSRTSRGSVWVYSGHPLYWSAPRAQHGGGGGPSVHQG